MSKILHAISKGEIGGAQSSLMSYLSALSGHKNTVLVGDDSLFLEVNAQKIGGTVVNHFSILSNPFRESFISQFIQIRKIIVLKNYDTIITHSFVASLILRFVLVGTKKRTVYVVHGFIGNKNVPIIKRTIGLLLENLTSSKVDKVIVLTEMEEASIRRVFRKQKVYVIPNTTHIQQVKTQEFKSESKERRVICLSRFAKPKLNRLIAQSFLASNLCSSEEWKLLFYGEGPHLNAVKELSKNSKNIKFFQPVFDVKPLLERADYLILLSEHEGQPMAILEAFAVGTKVICSNIAELREFKKYDMQFRLVENNLNSVVKEFNSIFLHNRDSDVEVENMRNFNKHLSPNKFKNRVNSALW